MSDRPVKNNPKTRGKGNRHGKRVEGAKETLQRLGENPMENMVRIASKAEKEGDLSTALQSWKEIQSYIEPKRKPVDPTEQAEKEQRIATLGELQSMKQAILDGTVKQIDKSKAISNTPDESDNNDLL